MNATKTDFDKGFTLLQISLLLTVAALVMVAVLPSSQTNLTARNISTAKMNTILAAVHKFQSLNGYIPCPANPYLPTGSPLYGVQGSTSDCVNGTPTFANTATAAYADTTKQIAIGMVPVKTLGLSKDYAVDGFGRDITYQADLNATACWTKTVLPGAITVKDSQPLSGGAATTTVTNNTVLALVSHGADGFGAWLPRQGTTGAATRFDSGSTDTNQAANAQVATGGGTTNLTNGNFQTLVRKPPTNTFDDLVVYQNPQWNLNVLPPSAQNTVSLVSAAPSISPIAPTTYGEYLEFPTPPMPLQFQVTFGGGVASVAGNGANYPYLQVGAIGYTASNGINMGINQNNVLAVPYLPTYGGSGTSTLIFSYAPIIYDQAPFGLTMASSINLNTATLTVGGVTQATGSCLLNVIPPANLSAITVASAPVYIADTGNNRIRRVINNTLSTYAGNGTAAYIGDGGPATSASLNGPSGIVMDSYGNLFISDTGNNRIREVTNYGIITTYAGTGVAGYTNSTNPLTAKFNAPGQLAIDSSNNIYVADNNNYVVREINYSTGAVTTVAGNHANTYSYPEGASGTSAPTSVALASPMGIAINSAGTNLYIALPGQEVVLKAVIASGTSNSIAQFAGTMPTGTYHDGVAASAAQLMIPAAVAVNLTGDVFISAAGDNLILIVPEDTSPGGLAAAWGMTIGHIYSVIGSGTSGYTDEPSGPAKSGKINSPAGMALDYGSDITFVDGGNNVVRNTTLSSNMPSNSLTTIAGIAADKAGGPSGGGTAANGDATSLTTGIPTAAGVWFNSPTAVAIPMPIAR